MRKNEEPLKDIDFLQLMKEFPMIFRLKLNEFERKSLLDKVEKDVQFLQSNNLMDYSLLLGIEQVFKPPSMNFGINDKSSQEKYRKTVSELGKHSVMSSCGGFIYHVAIIDYL